jgi:hypothetical protein
VKPIIPTPEERAKWRVKKICFGSSTPWPRRGWSALNVSIDLSGTLREANIPHRLLHVSRRATRFVAEGRRRSRVAHVMNYRFIVPHALVGEIIASCSNGDTVLTSRKLVRQLADGPGSDQWNRLRVLRALASVDSDDENPF